MLAVNKIPLHLKPFRWAGSNDPDNGQPATVTLHTAAKNTCKVDSVCGQRERSLYLPRSDFGKTISGGIYSGHRKVLRVPPFLLLWPDGPALRNQSDHRAEKDNNSRAGPRLRVLLLPDHHSETGALEFQRRGSQGPPRIPHIPKFPTLGWKEFQTKLGKPGRTVVWLLFRKLWMPRWLPECAAKNNPATSTPAVESAAFSKTSLPSASICLAEEKLDCEPQKPGCDPSV
ncbi:hypothetical protein H920_14938 [Fukomys damarensis]|uniref:Uncharacterized protein n=1 Tax=Fukomys damarensis TaxID=885580 RepID=A0A091CVR7_FUKDA|nr:hypothetical protein H920_14938 [Fukomys damarensis]